MKKLLLAFFFLAVFSSCSLIQDSDIAYVPTQTELDRAMAASILSHLGLLTYENLPDGLTLQEQQTTFGSVYFIVNENFHMDLSLFEEGLETVTINGKVGLLLPQGAVNRLKMIIRTTCTSDTWGGPVQIIAELFVGRDYTYDIQRVLVNGKEMTAYYQVRIQDIMHFQ